MSKCIVCGDQTDGSIGGPGICPSCDCGIDPKVKRLGAKLQECSSRNIDLILGLQVATGNPKGYFMTPEMIAIGERVVKEFTA